MESEVHKCIATKSAEKPICIHPIYNLFIKDEIYFVSDMAKPALNETQCIVRGRFANVFGEIQKGTLALSKKYCKEHLIKSK